MVTLALIGAGNWGKNYIKTVKKLKEAKLKYICVKKKDSFRRLPKGVLGTTNYKDLLSKKDIDGVIITTPTSTHYKIARDFLKEGFNLLIEKPLTNNLHEAEELVKIWKRKKPLVLIGHVYLYHPAYLMLKKNIRRVGKIKKIEFYGIQSSERVDTSVIWDWGPHPISLLYDLFNMQPEKLKVIKEHFNDDSVLDTLQLSMYVKDIKVKIHISWFGNKKIRKFIIKGTKRSLIFNDINETDKKLALAKKEKKIFLKFNKSLPLSNEIRTFVNAIDNKQTEISDLVTAVKIVNVLGRIEVLTSKT